MAEGAIPRVTAIAANNGPRWSAQAQQRIDAAAQDFGKQVEWRHIGPEALLALLQQRTPINEEVQLMGEATVETFDFRRVLIGRCPVAELARLAGKHGDQLFEKNIRRYLGLTGNRVNQEMASTLRCAPARKLPKLRPPRHQRRRSRPLHGASLRTAGGAAGVDAVGTDEITPRRIKVNTGLAQVG